MTRGRKVALVVVVVVLALVLVVGCLLALVVVSLGREPEVPSNSVLVLKVEGSLPDFSNADEISTRFFGAEPNSLSNLLLQLRKAKADKRVGAVLLDVGMVGGGWAKAEEIRDAVADFRKSGKPIYSYMEFGDDKSYFIATAAERVYVAPIGDLFINGLAAESMHFRGSFDKLGIFWDSYQIGKYKNAPEQFTRKDMSDGEKETINSLLDEIFNRYVSDVASARRMSEADVKALIDSAPHDAREAKEAGLIDGALYREDVEKELKKRLGYKEDEKLKKVSAAEYRRVTPDSAGLNLGPDEVAVVFASGAIMSGRSNDGSFGGEQTIGSDTVVKAINDARDNREVKAIVLRVDSPGGSVYPSDLIWNAVEEAKKKKPVVVSMSDLAASGGYYVSTGANKIVAEPLTFTGSIGIFAYKPVMKGFYDWVGVTSYYLTRGKNAGMFRETDQFTPDERTKFQAMLRHEYEEEFLPKVAQGRGRDKEYVRSIAEGRVWTGAQGRENGLVDEFGGLDRAVEVAKELAKIPADRRVRRVVYPAPRTFLQQLFGGGDDEDSARVRAEQQRAAFINSLPKDMQPVFRQAALFDSFPQGQMLAIMPFELKVE
jgi:protease IV